MVLSVGYPVTLPSVNKLGFIKTKDKKRNFRLTEEVGEKWQRIATTLGIANSKVSIIGSMPHADDTQRVTKVFQEWVDNASGLPNSKDYPHSWAGLRELLEDSGLAGVADRFFDVLKDS